ncbi:PD-(D/E)XK nuclease family protein [Oceanobacillus profundus]|uniref:PD-(D/E)XK endonuclease-like domain-containing protein n=1 Tax=Oceanobacillus profundus TaxID=372463 RepID=A0A417YG96_9BACI|nr:PD-(D/E)XK nuclease family protein [Oceanobacillus profundus]RHW31841.1 hypothetical protein D1B32_11415 [Oceanobacillus profundus]
MEQTVTLTDLYEFKRCSLRFKLTKVDKVTSVMNAKDGLHEALHSTINYFYYAMLDGKFLSMNDLKEKFSNIWYGEMDLYDIKLNGNQEKRKKELEAIEMLQTLHRKEQRNKDEIVAVNLDFRVPFGKELTVMDKIPLIRKTSRGHEIVNIKTGKQKYDEFWQRTDMGITLQALAFEGIFKKQADTIRIENIRRGDSTFLERKRSDYQRLYKSVRMMQKAMQEGWFYPNESFMCNSCPVKNICMEWR